MKCERQNECGFYKILEEQGIVPKSGQCAKKYQSECPRLNFANGINVEVAQQMLKVPDVLTKEAALTKEETRILFPNGLSDR
jgi:hypothetical protein